MELLKIGFWNGGPQWGCVDVVGKLDSLHPWVAFLMYNATCRPIFLGNSLKLQCHFGIMETELNRSVSEKMTQHTEMPCMKSNGRSEIMVRLKDILKYIFLVVLVSTILCLCLNCTDKKDGSPSQDKTYSQSKITNAFLNAVEQAKPNEFKDPESAIRFMFEQARYMNHDKASRVFPIIEEFQRKNFEDEARYLEVVSGHGMTLPNPSLQKLNSSLFGFLLEFDRLCLQLMTPDNGFPDQIMSLDKQNLDKEIEQWSKKLNVRNLAGLKVKSIERLDKLQDPRFRRPGASDFCGIEFVVENLGYMFVGQAFLDKYDTNWKIRHFEILETKQAH